MGDTSNFQVDLRGIVDLLSHHLYSSERIFLRELLQNAVDAISARREVAPDAPARIEVATDGMVLTVADSGIGLTPGEIGEFLATIGRSSKRDQLGFQRDGFLGQFGIGLLSAFMVADEVRVVTRPEDGPVSEWVGRADGTYELTECAETVEVGTTVQLRPSRGAEHWFDPATVTDLVQLFGSMLPAQVSVNGREITATPPWDRRQDPAARTAALVGFAQDNLGFTPFDTIELSVPIAGLEGVAFVLPFAGNPAERAKHRVYLKGMLLSEGVEGLVPDWAFFVRCLVTTSGLRPTASREALFEEPLLDETREAIGDQIRRWLVRLGTTRPAKLSGFLQHHRLGVLALAIHDDDMLRLVDQWVPFETNVGTMTLAELRERHGDVRYTATTETFRSLGVVAAAQGVALLNGGYTYVIDVVERLPAIDHSVKVTMFEPSELSMTFDELAPDAAAAVRPFVQAAQESLDEVGCEVVVRDFEPASLPALYLVDHETEYVAERRRTRAGADGLWAEVLGALDTDAEHDVRPQLVFNHRSPLVRRLTTLGDASVIRMTVEGLYGQALLQGNHPVRPADSALINRSLLELLEQAIARRNHD